jgi:dolichol kinase
MALTILIPLTLLFGLSDIIRLVHPTAGQWYRHYFGFLLRDHEQNDHGKKLNGATYVLISATLCVLIFPKVIVVTAFTILIISDTSAALIGRKFGRRPFLRKTLEGSTAFFVTALIVVAVTPKIVNSPAEYFIGAAAALLGAIIEAVSNNEIDDNLSIPITVGTAMWLMYVLFLPSVNVLALDKIR